MGSSHFHRPSGEAVAIQTHVHLFSDHVMAARRVDFALIEMQEGTIGDDWLKKKPKWGRFRGQPISFVMVWRRSGSPRTVR